MTDFLSDIDANIYAYAVELIEGVYERFKEKKELAVYFRDWKPARKLWGYILWKWIDCN